MFMIFLYLHKDLRISKTKGSFSKDFVLYGSTRADRHFVGWSEINQNTRAAVSGQILGALLKILKRRK
jgi:hypothetical protein